MNYTSFHKKRIPLSILTVLLVLSLAMAGAFFFWSDNTVQGTTPIHVTSEDTGFEPTDSYVIEDLLETEAKLRAEYGDDLREIVWYEGALTALLSDGAISVNPTSGETIWSYRVPDSNVGVGWNRSEPRTIVSYDTPHFFGTEETRVSPGISAEVFELEEIHPVEDPMERLSQITEELIVTANHGDSGDIIEARNVTTNTLEWTYDVAEACPERQMRQEEDYSIAVTGGQVLLSLSCNEGASILALNAEDGVHMWTHAWESAPSNAAYPTLHPMTYRYVPSGSGDPVTASLRGDLSGSYSFLSENIGLAGLPDHFDFQLMRTGELVLPVDPDEPQAPDHVIVGDMREYRPESRVQAVRLLIDQGQLPEERFEDVLVEGRDGTYRFPYSSLEWDIIRPNMDGLLTDALEALDP